MKILMFGKGEICDVVIRTYDINKNDIVGYVESSPRADTFNGKPMYHVRGIENVEYDYIYIANRFYQTLQEIIDVGVAKEKIVICNIKVAMEYYEKNEKMDIRCMFPGVLTNLYHNHDVEGVQSFDIGNSKFFISDDFCRIGTLKLVTDEIKKNNVPGDVAELGVYRGDFSQYINRYLPDRRLHLFDTFEGFDDRSVSKQIGNGFDIAKEIHGILKDTSVELVLSKMPYKERVKIYKGYFPETAPKEDLCFSFVSLDCDLYQPMLDGLRYFYPRVSMGGYLMLHDYGNAIWDDGIEKSVQDYENETGIRLHKAPIPDKNGSVVISK